jgi:hypothetical protein
MKTTLVTLLAAASALALSLPASASEPSYEPFVNQATTASRAAVQASAAGTDVRAAYSPDGGTVTVVAVAGSTLSRAQVQAQRSDEVRSLALWPDALQQQPVGRMALRSAVIGAAAAAQAR